MVGAAGPLAGIPSALAAMSGAIGHLSWEKNDSSRLEVKAMFDKILVAVDHSEISDRALDAARDLALLSEGEVWVLHMREREVAVKTGVSLSDESMDEARAAVAAAVDKLTAAGVKAYGDVGITLFGYAARNIVDDAKEHDVDVIVMGSRGRGDLAGLILGSTAHKVIHLADRPVLIVR
jgi:nucleotide-binding universal stress UspA family protein